MTIHLTSETFDEFVKSSTNPVLIDFWAEWCGPCKMIAPLIDEMSIEMSSSFSIAKVDVDAFPELAARFDVRSIPALLVFKDGNFVKRVQTSSGLSKAKIIDGMNKAISNMEQK